MKTGLRGILAADIAKLSLYSRDYCKTFTSVNSWYKKDTAVTLILQMMEKQDHIQVTCPESHNYAAKLDLVPGIWLQHLCLLQLGCSGQVKGFWARSDGRYHSCGTWMWMWVTRREEKVEDDWAWTRRGRLCKTRSTVMVIWMSICKSWGIPGSSEWMKRISILER